MTANVLFGAIRWDAVWNPLTGTNPGDYVRGNLSDNDLQFRAPKHAQVIGNNVITFNANQTAFDAEITFANSCGLHYWAYLLYAEGDVMNSGLNYHLASSIASQQKFVLMISTNVMGTTSTYTSFVDNLVNKYISKSYYLTLSSGAPVIYIYYSPDDIINFWGGNIANFATAVSYLKTKTAAVTGHTPYVIAMVGASNTLRTQIGADAITNYISGFPGVINGAYTALDTATQSYWGSLATAVGGGGGQIVPICMCGWSTIPRKRRPPPWEVATSIAGVRGVSVYLAPTNAELASHVQSAVTYLNSNPTITPNRLILCYSWSENDEGGSVLSQTLGDPTGTRLQAVGAVIA